MTDDKSTDDALVEKIARGVDPKPLVRTSGPDCLARIGLLALERWSDGYSDLDFYEVQELAVLSGALTETVFDPAKHTDEIGDAEAGDPWFLFSDEVNRYRTPPAQEGE